MFNFIRAHLFLSLHFCFVFQTLTLHVLHILHILHIMHCILTIFISTRVFNLNFSFKLIFNLIVCQLFIPILIMISFTIFLFSLLFLLLSFSLSLSFCSLFLFLVFYLSQSFIFSIFN